VAATTSDQDRRVEVRTEVLERIRRPDRHVDGRVARHGEADALGLVVASSTSKVEVAAERIAQSNAAPTVLAAGTGEAADRILALGREFGVPIREDAALAHALARLQLEAEIPPELWTAVAEALVWAYRLSAQQQLDM
jgi:flagellar biosynthesis protein